MTVEDALKAIAAIEGLHDGTQATESRIERLTDELLKRPETFWEQFFDAVGADSPIRIKAEALLRSRAVTEDSTFADMKQIPNGAGDAK